MSVKGNSTYISHSRPRALSVFKSARGPIQKCLLSLPDEVLLKIFLCLSTYKDVIALSLACKRLYRVGCDERIWQTFSRRVDLSRELFDSQTYRYSYARFTRFSEHIVTYKDLQLNQHELQVARHKTAPLDPISFMKQWKNRLVYAQGMINPTIFVYHPEKERHECIIKTPFQSEIASLIIHQNRMLASSKTGSMIRVWDLQEKKALSPISIGNVELCHLKVVAKHYLFIVQKRMITVFDLNTDTVVFQRKFRDRLSVFKAYHEWLGLGFENRKLTIILLKDFLKQKEVCAEHFQLSGPLAYPLDIKFVGHRLFCAWSSGHFTATDYLKGKSITKNFRTSVITKIKQYGPFLLCPTKTGYISVLQISDLKCVRSIPLGERRWHIHQLRQDVVKASIARYGDIVFSSCGSPSIFVNSLSRGERLHHLGFLGFARVNMMPGEEGIVLIKRIGDRIFFGGEGGSLAVLDMGRRANSVVRAITKAFYSLYLYMEILSA